MIHNFLNLKLVFHYGINDELVSFLFLCAQKVFKQLEGTDESVIAADDMRLAMANAFVV